ncbi:selenoprotein S [Anguilla rostrata]|uniref:selenoprotein S n=1 Tax=Anguilla rostrata TaxID=7938 RepID=UPI0030D0979F
MEADEETTEIKTETTVENQDLSFLQQTVGVFVAEYGWCLLLLCVGVYLLIQHLSKRRSSQEAHWSGQGTDEADTVAVVKRQEALEASRRRMQEELNAKAMQYKEKQQTLQEEKRKQKIEMWESMQQGKSYQGNAKVLNSTEEASTSTVVKPKSDKKPLRNSGFNPLTGEGGGACVWRPGRRGPSAGG